MNKRTLIVLFLLVLLAFGVFGENVDFRLGKFGVHTTAGVLLSFESYNQPALWFGGTVHLSPLMALRPEFLVLVSHRNEDDSFTSSGSNRDTRSFGGSLDLLFYLPVKTLYVYLGPGFGVYHRSSRTENYDGSGYESDDFDFNVSATTGGLYMLSEQFGFFGEISLGVDWIVSNDRDWNTSGATTSDEQTRTTQFLIQRASLGAVFYFN